MGYKCDQCKDTGLVLLEKVDDCPRCDGFGEEAEGGPCWGCEGQGIVPVIVRVPCSTCGGDLKQDEPDS